MALDPDMQELLRLTKENNRMLHKMNRRAIWGGIIKFVLYGIVFIALPLWVYTTYLAPILDQMTKTYEQIQGTGARANAQFDNFENALKQFKTQFSGQE